MKAFCRRHKDVLALGLVLLLYAVLLRVLAITCPIKHLFGISCPGCGMTRAWLAAVRLDFVVALQFHPLWWTLPLFALAFLFFRHKKVRWALRTTLLCFILLFFAVYFYRLLFTPSPVVEFAPQTGRIAEALRRLQTVFSAM